MSMPATPTTCARVAGASPAFAHPPPQSGRHGNATRAHARLAPKARPMAWVTMQRNPDNDSSHARLLL